MDLISKDMIALFATCLNNGTNSDDFSAFGMILAHYAWLFWVKEFTAMFDESCCKFDESCYKFDGSCCNFDESCCNFDGSCCVFDEY